MQAQAAPPDTAPVPTPPHSARSGLDLRICAVAAAAGVLCGGVAVLFRLALGNAQRCRVNNIELNMMTIQSKICSNKLRDFIYLIIGIQKLRSKFLIKQSSAGPQMVYL